MLICWFSKCLLMLLVKDLRTAYFSHFTAMIIHLLLLSRDDVYFMTTLILRLRAFSKNCQIFELCMNVLY